MIAKRVALLATMALMAAPLSGCLSFLKDDETLDAADVNAGVKDLVDAKAQERLESTLSAVPKNYTFPGQNLLPPTVFYFNDTMDTSANLGFEDKNDRAGNAYGLVRKTTDVSQLVPPGQPAELLVTLYYYNQAGDSAKCDIFVDVPGTTTSYNSGNNDEFNWKFSVQRMIVNTIGVSGRPHEVGVECANGRMTSGVDFTIRIDVTYVKDVLTPYVPWAFTVPANASGVILESVKAGGPEHLKSWFMIVGPNDQIVDFVEFNDIAIPTESVFVATPTPGEYVFYAHNMTGGFLSLRADAPVELRDVRPLALVEERVVDKQGAAPGVASRDWAELGVVNDPAGGEELSFSVDGAFPLRVDAFIDGGSTLMTDVRISSSKGVVAGLQRVLRHDDGSGSLGLTRDEHNAVFNPENLEKGTYIVQIVNDSPDATLGHVVTTYKR